MKWLLLVFWLDGAAPVPVAPGPIGVFAHPVICEIAGAAVTAALIADTGRLATHRCVTGSPA